MKTIYSLNVFRFLRTLNKTIISVFCFVFGIEPKNEAHLMTWAETKDIVNTRHTGFVLDGKNKCLSREESFKHLIVLAPTGQGKTSSIIIPNILKVDRASIVVTDPSRELYDLTSGALARKGYKIQLIDFSRPQQSLGFNPLAQITCEGSGALAHILIKSANSLDYQGNSKFWYASTEQLVKVLIDFLVVLEKPQYLNLPNLRHLLNYVLHPGFLDFVQSKIGAHQVLNALKGQLSVNTNMLQSYVAIAMSSLQLMEKSSLASMMTAHELNFAGIRQQKIAIFVAVPSEALEQYAFLVNLFYAQLFQTLFAGKRGEGLDVFLFLDEAGHLAIPNFASIITTIRKYRVGIMAAYQAKSQLDDLYGRHQAHTILSGGFYNKLILPGIEHESAAYFSNTIGMRERTGRMSPLLPPDRIRVRESGSSILLGADREPMSIRLSPYFKTSLQELTKIPSVPYPEFKNTTVHYLDLEI